MVKKIAILTSGGDCAGLNAVIRAVTLSAHNKYNWEVYGIKDGTLGLLKEPLDVIKLNPQNFEGSLMRMGGTFLGSNNKGNPFKNIKRISKIPKIKERISFIKDNAPKFLKSFLA